MDYDKLIERFNNDAKDWAGDGYIKRDLQDAATVIGILHDDLTRVTAERDLAIEYVRGQCRYCKRNLVCTSRHGPHKYCWEWRGIKED